MSPTDQAYIVLVELLSTIALPYAETDAAKARRDTTKIFMMHRLYKDE